MPEQLPSEVLSVGDIGIITGSTYFPENVGRECVVLMPLDWYRSQQTQKLILSYKIELDGRTYLARPENLRKKRPPREDLQVVRWDQCPWQPESINV
jgi:hypothetical protein